jgi:hypothetical protein
MAWVLTLLLAASFWETKPAAQWTDIEIDKLLTDSAWGQMIPGTNANMPPVQVYLATAQPVRLAEQERDRRARSKISDPLFAEEYRAWLEENSRTQIILAVRVGNSPAYSDAKELDELETSVLRVGRKKIPLTGYFPPSAGDPYLRLAFPRQVQATDKQISFELYLPGVAGPFRQAEFKIAPMLSLGKLEL